MSHTPAPSSTTRAPWTPSDDLLDALVAVTQHRVTSLAEAVDSPVRTVRVGENDVDLLTAAEMVEDAFGARGLDEVHHAATTGVTVINWQERPLPTRRQCAQAATLVRAGWTQEDGFDWWARVLDDLPLSLAAAWVGRWGLESLNTCVRAGMQLPELEGAMDTDVLPPMSEMRVLAALAKPVF